MRSAALAKLRPVSEPVACGTDLIEPTTIPVTAEETAGFSQESPPAALVQSSRAKTRNGSIIAVVAWWLGGGSDESCCATVGSWNEYASCSERNKAVVLLATVLKLETSSPRGYRVSWCVRRTSNTEELCFGNTTMVMATGT